MTTTQLLLSSQSHGLLALFSQREEWAHVFVVGLGGLVSVVAAIPLAIVGERHGAMLLVAAGLIIAAATMAYAGIH